MGTSTARVKLHGRGGEIEVNGTNLRGVRSLQLVANAGELPTLQVSFLASDAEAEMEEVRVVVDDQTRAALVALGWTPPPSD